MLTFTDSAWPPPPGFIGLIIHLLYFCWADINIYRMLLSPVPSFTSEPTPSPPKPPIFLISSLRSFSDCLSSYLPCSVSIHPCFPFCPTLSYLLCDDVDSTSCPCDRSSPRTPYPLLLPNSDTRARSAPWFRTPPVFKPVVSIDTNQSDYCVSYVTLHLIPLSRYSRFFLSSFCKPPLTNSLSPDSVRLRSPTSPKL